MCTKNENTTTAHQFFSSSSSLKPRCAFRLIVRNRRNGYSIRSQIGTMEDRFHPSHSHELLTITTIRNHRDVKTSGGKQIRTQSDSVNNELLPSLPLRRFLPTIRNVHVENLRSIGKECDNSNDRLQKQHDGQLGFDSLKMRHIRSGSHIWAVRHTSTSHASRTSKEQIGEYEHDQRCAHSREACFEIGIDPSVHALLRFTTSTSVGVEHQSMAEKEQP